MHHACLLKRFDGLVIKGTRVSGFKILEGMDCCLQQLLGAGAKAAAVAGAAARGRVNRCLCCAEVDMVPQLRCGCVLLVLAGLLLVLRPAGELAALLRDPVKDKGLRDEPAAPSKVRYTEGLPLGTCCPQQQPRTGRRSPAAVRAAAVRSAEEGVS